MMITTVTDSRELLAHEDSVRILAATTRCENVFYEAWMLAPALDLLRETAEVSVLLFWDKRRLVGILPLRRIHGYRGLPLTYMAAWRHLHCFLSAPLFERGIEQECYASLWLWSAARKIPIVLLEQIPVDAELVSAATSSARDRGFAFDEFNAYERPLMRRAESAERYLQGAMPAKRRRDLTSKLKRLESHGAVTFHAVQHVDELNTWVSEFLSLEGHGWKGRAGTAMIQRTNEARYFEAVVKNAFYQHRLDGLSLLVDGRPVAMRCGFRAGSGSFSFKIAYDETYAKYSPGLLLEAENLNVIHSDPSILWSDSCAMPGSPLFERIWTETLRMTSLAVATSWLGRAAVQGIPLMKRIYEYRRAST